MIMEHIGIWGLVCSAKGLKILLDICEGLLGVCCIPLGPIFVVVIVVMIAHPCSLKVHDIDIPVIDAIECQA